VDWVPDYVELADHLGLPSAPIIGWSAGGPSALAVAAVAPERVSIVGLAASPAPGDEMPGAWDALPPEIREIIGLARRDLASAMPALARGAQWFADDWQSWHSDSPSNPDSPDERLFREGKTLEALNDQFMEGARQGSTGLVLHRVAASLPWGFTLRQVTRPVRIWWGDADTIVDRVDSEFLAHAIPNATLTVYPGDGHFFPIKRWADLLATVLSV
jgi:pimeloyl-ACP methyl ester carboxylesterase